MTAPRRRKQPARPQRRRAAPTRDFWGGAPADDESVNLIRPSDDPTAMIRSLGPPPFPGGETIAEHYFSAVYQKAATLATALAAASGLLDTATFSDDRSDDEHVASES
jgi:hypothetical protein